MRVEGNGYFFNVICSVTVTGLPLAVDSAAFLPSWRRGAEVEYAWSVAKVSGLSAALPTEG